MKFITDRLRYSFSNSVYICDSSAVVTSQRALVVDLRESDLVAGVELQVVGELEVHYPRAQLDLGVRELPYGLGHHDLPYLVDAPLDGLENGLTLRLRGRG